MINAIGQKIHADLSQEQLECLIRLLEERKQQIVEQLSEAANRSDVEAQMDSIGKYKRISDLQTYLEDLLRDRQQ